LARRLVAFLALDRLRKRPDGPDRVVPADGGAPTVIAKAVARHRASSASTTSSAGGGPLVYNRVANGRGSGLWRIHATKPVRLRKGPAAGLALAATATQVVVRRGPNFELVDAATGTTDASFAAPAPIEAARTSTRALVVQQGSRLDLRRLPGGQLVRTFQRPARADLAAVGAVLAAYISGGLLHLLRPADGRQIAVRFPYQATAPPGALTDGGLFVAYKWTKRLPIAEWDAPACAAADFGHPQLSAASADAAGSMPIAR